LRAADLTHQSGVDRGVEVRHRPALLDESSAPTGSHPPRAPRAPCRPWRTPPRARSIADSRGIARTAPRTIWSACFGSTPSRNEMSTDRRTSRRHLLRQTTASSRSTAVSGCELFVPRQRLLDLTSFAITTTSMPMLRPCPR
jgi:hypothetical protein